jgi:hypothetical protein
MDAVNHPNHYGGKDNLYEAIKVIDAWEADFYIGNVLKYLCRSEKKGNRLEDLKKAQFYLNEKVKRVEQSQSDAPLHRISSTFETY